MVEAMKIMRAPSKGPMYALLHSAPPALQQAASDPRLRRRLVDTQQVPDSLLWGHCSFLQVLVHKVLLCPPRVYFPVGCKFCQLYGRVNGDLLQESLCHTQVCCTQPYPFGGKCIDQTGLKSWWFQTFNLEPGKFFKN